MKPRCLLVAALLLTTACGDDNGKGGTLGGIGDASIKGTDGAAPSDSGAPPTADSGTVPTADSGGVSPGSCAAIWSCSTQCPDENWEACEQQCLSKASPQAQQLIQAMYDCIDAAFEGSCLADCQGTDFDKCDACLVTACTAPLNACLADQ
jgi:hypothetical protein